MHGLVSLLPQPYYDKVTSFWETLEEEFGLMGIWVTPFPHFSWTVFDDCSHHDLETLMTEISAQVRPFAIKSSGIGIFSGSSPVVFIPAIKTKELLGIHQEVWDRFSEIGKGISPYYSPESWNPHISLAYQDVDGTNIGPTIKWLAAQNTNWEMTIDNFTYIYEPDGEIGKLRMQFELNEQT